MNADVALYWVREALQLSVFLTAPLLGTALVVGVIVSLAQAVTSIQEMTLSYIPKMLMVGVVLALLAPWMLQMLADFNQHVLEFIPSVSR